MKSARTLRHLKLLINDETIPLIMQRTPHADWKEWATNCPEWIHKNVEDAFQRFVEHSHAIKASSWLVWLPWKLYQEAEGVILSLFGMCKVASSHIL